MERIIKTAGGWKAALITAALMMLLWKSLDALYDHWSQIGTLALSLALAFGFYRLARICER